MMRRQAFRLLRLHSCGSLKRFPMVALWTSMRQVRRRPWVHQLSASRIGCPHCRCRPNRCHPCACLGKFSCAILILLVACIAVWAYHCRFSVLVWSVRSVASRPHLPHPRSMLCSGKPAVQAQRCDSGQECLLAALTCGMTAAMPAASPTLPSL